MDGKNRHNGDNEVKSVNTMGSAVECVRSLLVKELLGSIDRGAVVSASGRSVSGDRLFGYINALSDAAQACLRYSVVEGMVYVFDGRVWRPVGDEEKGLDSRYYSVVNKTAWEVLRKCSDGVRDSDLLAGESRFGKAITEGAMSSVLQEGESVIGFRNGVWDFNDPLNPVRHSFEERLGIKSVRGYDYAPSRGCPAWERFLGNTLSGADMETLQCFFGLGVVPRTKLGHSVEKMLWLVGNGGNGKSTCLDVLEYVYGEGLFSHASLPTLLDSNNISRMLGTSPIIGKRYNRCDEIQMSDITKKMDLLKRLCSADHVEYRRIKGNAMSSNEVPFFVFSMNKVPTSRSTDPALLRRLLIVRFGYSVKAEDMNTGLYMELKREASGIWNWCVEGYRKLLGRGFLFPRSVDNDVEQKKLMMASGQQMEVWLQDEGLMAQGRNRLQKPYRVMLSTLFERYKEWCENNDVELDCENAYSFGRMMSSGSKNRAGLGYVKKRAAMGMFFEVYSDNKIDYGI